MHFLNSVSTTWIPKALRVQAPPFTVGRSPSPLPKLPPKPIQDREKGGGGSVAYPFLSFARLSQSKEQTDRPAPSEIRYKPGKLCKTTALMITWHPARLLLSTGHAAYLADQ